MMDVRAVLSAHHNHLILQFSTVKIIKELRPLIIKVVKIRLYLNFLNLWCILHLSDPRVQWTAWEALKGQSVPGRGTFK